MVCIFAFAAGVAERPAFAEDTEPSAVYVAQVGSTKYATLQGAVDHMASGGTITLLTDVRLTDTVSLSSVTWVGFYLDMNGHNITGNCTIFAISGETTLYLENPEQTGGTITSTSPAQSAVTILSSPDNGGMQISDVSIVSENAAGIECNGGTVLMLSGRIEGGTYGVSCDNGDFGFFGGMISGGTAYFTSQTGCKPTFYYQDETGYQTEISEDGKAASITGAVETTVAGITRYFPTLQEAVDYCPDNIYYEGGNVKFKLMEDLEINQTVAMGSDNYWPLDLNGHQITGSGTLFKNDSRYGFLIENTSDQPATVTTSSADVPAILNFGVLSLKNVTLSGGSCGINMKKSPNDSWDPSLVLDGGGVTCENGAGVKNQSGTVSLVAGTVSGTPYAFCDTDGAHWTGYTLGENSAYLTNTDPEVTIGLRHALSVTAGTGGSITADGSGNYLAGTQISISAVPHSGYYFDGWRSSGGGTFEDASSASTVFTMPGTPATVTANFVPISYNAPDTYTIQSLAGTGGGISPSGNTAIEAGGNQTYTVTADDGYESKAVLVDGVSVGAADSYTFKNVKRAHTIAAFFTEKKVVNPFGDMGNSDWFYDDVMYVYQNGLMNGTASDTFSPNGSMTRGMFVAVLYRLSGDTGSYPSGFTDVPSGKWYENAVAWAAQNGISDGVGNNRFAPDSGITREQLAVLLYDYAKYKGYDVSIGENINILSYKDALNISDYAYPALRWACGAGIMKGDSGYLSPNGQATRAQVAAMLARFVENADR